MSMMHKSPKTLSGLASLLLTSCTAFALISCIPVQSHAQTQADMNIQSYKESQIADAAMNKAYKQLMSKLDQTGQTKLRAAQRAWIVFRDRETTFAGDFARGGTMAPLLRNKEYTGIAQDRTQDLKVYFQEYSSR